MSHGNCSCHAALKREETKRLISWVCQHCGEVWHSQPADQWPPPKLKDGLKPRKPGGKLPVFTLRDDWVCPEPKPWTPEDILGKDWCREIEEQIWEEDYEDFWATL